MKKLFLVALLVFYSQVNGQQNEIRLETKYGSENKEIQNLLRFQGIETTNFKFTGEPLKGKDYMVLLKEYTNGKLARIDTIVNSKKYSYIKAIDSTEFQFGFCVQTQLNNTVKMEFKFNRFSIPRIISVKKEKDKYALHDFLGAKKSIPIKLNTAIYIMGYFLPYTDKDTGWKKYCEVSGSKHSPEDWGKVFSIPNYFLVEILFQE